MYVLLKTNSSRHYRNELACCRTPMRSAIRVSLNIFPMGGCIVPVYIQYV